MIINNIDRIKENADIAQVIGSFVKIKKQGANYQGCCPFHNEKTPSFVVSPAKGIYKCFGCGAGGDAISFVMQHERQNFTEAVITIGKIVGIEAEIEERKLTAEEKQQLTDAEKQAEVLNFVVPILQKNLFDLPETHAAKIWLRERNIDDETIAEWQLGWCSEEWKSLTTPLINKGWFEPAFQLGIIKRSNDNNYDGYRSRIIFPIRNKDGKYIGLGGRYIRILDSDAASIPKYINPAECAIYNKSTVFYGLNVADKHIVKDGAARIVEGYMDVISAHLGGFKNTIATCGTSFTDKHMRILKRLCSNVYLWFDNDSAGDKASKKHLPELLKMGFNVYHTNYFEKDPDEYVRASYCAIAAARKNVDFEILTLRDGILWYADAIWQQGGLPIVEQAIAKKQILEVLSLISDEILRNHYFDRICKELDWKTAVTKKEFSNIIEAKSKELESTDDFDLSDEEKIKWAPWVSEEMKEQMMSIGYLPIDRKEKGKPMIGYYSFNQNGKTEITNFLVNPLFRIEAGQDNSRYLSEIDNGYKKVVIDTPARVFPSIDQFQAICVGAGGAFIIYGSKMQWLRIATDLLHKYPICKEVKELGWNKMGHFFAYVDKVIVPGKGLIDLDDWGIVRVNEVDYLITAGSKALKRLQEFGNDPYENLRYITFMKSPITFSQWANLMYKVYGNKGIVAIAYTILTVYRDIVFDVDNNCPHLYAYGEPSSGKSKWAESITAVFFKNRSALNMNSGTINAFFAFMSLYANCPAHLNEFDQETMGMERFQAIKSAFDGEGRERGKVGPKNATEIQKVVSTLILTGQKLVTIDDNSVVTRCIIEAFSTVENRSQEQINAYDSLKGYEKQGLNSMLEELVMLRQHFQSNYKNSLNNQLSYWRKNNPKAGQLNQRILQNWAHLFTCYFLASQHIQLPVITEDFKNYCFEAAEKWSGFIRSTDTLSEFWRTVEFLYNASLLIEDWDFIVEDVTNLQVRKTREAQETISFLQPTKVLFIRLNNAHKLFQSDFRKRTGREAMPMDSLIHYFSSRKYFIGNVKSKKFKRIINNYKDTTLESNEGTRHVIAKDPEWQFSNTSCYAFKYDELEINIGNGNDAAETPPTTGETP